MLPTIPIESKQMVITKYSNLSDSELLLKLNGSRNHSDVLEELCQRLEDKIQQAPKQELHNKAICPVCEATLFVDDDAGIDSFNLKVFSDVNPG